MPALSPTFELEGGVTLGELRSDLDAWITDLPLTPEEISQRGLWLMSRQTVQDFANGPISVLGAMSQEVGFLPEEMAPVVSAMRGTVRVLRQALSAFKEAAKVLIADIAKDLANALGKAAQDLLDSLSKVAMASAAIPVAGWIVAIVIALIKAAASAHRYFWAFLDQPKQEKCSYVDLRTISGAADRDTARALLRLLDLQFSSGDITSAFLPPSRPGILRQETDFGLLYLSGFGYAPLIGSDFAAWAPLILQEKAPKNEQERAAWRAAWYRAAGAGDPGPWLRGPWLEDRVGAGGIVDPCGPSRRGGAPSKMSAWQRNTAIRDPFPTSAFPKSTTIAGSLFSLASGTGPLSLAVDWHGVASAWTHAFDAAAGSWRAAWGDPGTIGGCEASMAGLNFDPLHRATFIYDGKKTRTALAFTTQAGPKTGDGLIQMPRDFVDFLATKTPANPVEMWGAAPPSGMRNWYGCAYPNGAAHGIHTIRYACQKLAIRQQKIARTDAAAYMPEKLIKSSPLRPIVEDTRARILAGGASGIDLDMAEKTGGIEWRKACTAAKMQTLKQGTPPPKASSAGPADLFMPIGEPVTPSTGGGAGAALAIGGLAAAALAIGARRG